MATMELICPNAGSCKETCDHHERHIRDYRCSFQCPETKAVVTCKVLKK